jgi:hypothetical protein
MNKTVLGFLVGVVLVCGGFIAWLAISKTGTSPTPAASAPARPAPKAPIAPSAPPAAPAAPAAETPAAALTEMPKETTATQAANQPPAPSGDVVLDMTREIGNGGRYRPGEPIDVTIRLMRRSGEEEIRALGLSEKLPDGFEFVEMTGDTRADVPPKPGTTVVAEFAWITIPKFPATISYRIKAAEGTTGEKVLSGEALYRTNGPELRTGVVTSTLRPDDGSTPAPAPAPAAEPPAGANQANQAAQSLREMVNRQSPEQRGRAERIPPVPPAAPGNKTAAELNAAPIELARAFAVDTYPPGGTVDVQITLNYAGEQVTAMAVLEDIPPGWSFAGIVGGDGPTVPPAVGKTGQLTFIWVSIPTFPATFTYQLKVPEGESGPRTFSGYAVYRTSGPQITGPPAQSQISNQ